MCGGGPGTWRSVVILEERGEAGLVDRTSSIAHVANMAASVCARVVVPPPCELLSTTRHNLGKALPCTEGWSRYASIRYAMASDAEALPLAESTHQVEARVVSPTAESVAAGYDEAWRLAAAGTSFAWQIGANYREWKRSAQEHVAGVAVSTARRKARRSNISRCEYVVTGPSPRVAALADDFVRSTRLPSRFATLHVRRTGDEKSSSSSSSKRRRGATCDTSVAAVTRYAACSLLPLGTLLGASSASSSFLDAVVLFTDERDEAYVAAVVANLEATLRAAGGARVVHGDAALRALAARDRDDNFFIFGAAMSVMHRARVRLRMQRTHCEPCDRAARDAHLRTKLAILVKDRLHVEEEEEEEVPRLPEPPKKTNKKRRRRRRGHKTTPEPPPEQEPRARSVVGDAREQLSYACRAPTDDPELRGSRRNATLALPGPARPLRVLSWISRHPSQYDWSGDACVVSPPLIAVAAAYGAAFGPDAASRRRALVEGVLPCDLVRDKPPSSAGVETFGLDVSALDYARLDAILFPRPYVGVSALARGARYDASRSLLPRKQHSWILHGLDEPPSLAPAASDPRFLDKFDLTFGPHPGLFDVLAFGDFFPTANAALLWTRPRATDLGPEFWDDKTETALAAFDAADDDRCDASSNRDDYAAEMATLVPVRFAAAARGTCPSFFSGGDLVEVSRAYKFVLAFEAANCVSWVTAQLYAAMDAGAVPVFRGAPDARLHLVPNRSAVIFADDFASPHDLATHLAAVSADRDLYLRHHAWRHYPLDPAFLQTLGEALRRPTPDDILPHVRWG
ncbi:hypothetical protein CTAYLR_006479 [Chrysophaeum taylorii]|uniref:Fucosyltransferase n=1 Tax=Chrysophaeum taylorii TaxID=2483200 RepID=A0AAD7UMS8_9STRA|nr:hypothetical protein CTAYLR_006479 [Chrysophaeum taylorii]